MHFTRGYEWEGEEQAEAMVYLTRKVRIRLTDPEKKPLANGRCRITDEPETVYQCDENGVAEIPVSDSSQSYIDLEWEPVNAADNGGAEPFCWNGMFQLNAGYADDQSCEIRLANLGFGGDTLADQVKAYQTYFNRTATGDPGDIRDELMNWHEGGDRPLP